MSPIERRLREKSIRENGKVVANEVCKSSTIGFKEKI